MGMGEWGKILKGQAQKGYCRASRQPNHKHGAREILELRGTMHRDNLHHSCFQSVQFSHTVMFDSL